MIAPQKSGFPMLGHKLIDQCCNRTKQDKDHCPVEVDIESGASVSDKEHEEAPCDEGGCDSDDHFFLFLLALSC